MRLVVQNDNDSLAFPDEVFVCICACKLIQLGPKTPFVLPTPPLSLLNLPFFIVQANLVTFARSHSPELEHSVAPESLAQQSWLAPAKEPVD